MKPVLTRLKGDCAGRTLVELIVVLAVAAMVVMIINATQIHALRWSRQDQQTAAINRPLREATNFLTRDVELAASTAVSGGQLVLTHDRRRDDGTRLHDTITYYLEDGTLKRLEVTAEGTTNLRLFTSGLDLFDPSITPTGLVKVRFSASSFGTDARSRELVLEIISRRGVGANAPASP